MDYEKIEKISDVKLEKGINLEKYTTIKLGATGSIVKCQTVQSLSKVLGVCYSENLIYHIVGWGSNQVLHNCSTTLFIKLELPFDREIFSKPQDKYNLPASLALNSMTSHAVKFGLKGWNVFTGIPANLGGAIYMNAGTSLGEIGELVESVEIMRPTGKTYTHICNSGSFSYRKNNFVENGEIIISAVLHHKGLDSGVGRDIKKYLELRKTSQPLTSKNCGCVFKNYSDKFKAGLVIDRLGLKGYGTENLSVSLKHANFIENHNNSTSEEFLGVVSSLNDEIERQIGLKFELEVKIY